MKFAITEVREDKSSCAFKQLAGRFRRSNSKDEVNVKSIKSINSKENRRSECWDVGVGRNGGAEEVLSVQASEMQPSPCQHMPVLTAMQ
ncbi:hypothetical protein STEG23_020944, partial [Scotinomys teguina]